MSQEVNYTEVVWANPNERNVGNGQGRRFGVKNVAPCPWAWGLVEFNKMPLSTASNLLKSQTG